MICRVTVSLHLLLSSRFMSAIQNWRQEGRILIAIVAGMEHCPAACVILDDTDKTECHGEAFSKIKSFVRVAKKRYDT